MHACEFVGHHLIVPLLARFLEDHPAIDVVLTQPDRPVDLIKNNMDVSILTERSGEMGHHSLVMRRLGSWPRVVCASPDYLARRGTPSTPQDLEHQDCLT